MFLFLYRRVILLTLVICSVTITALGQENRNSGNRYEVSLGGFVQSNAVIDEKFSNLTFSGTNPGFFAAFELRGEIAEHVLESAYSGGTVKTEDPVAFSAASHYLTINYCNLFRLYQSRNESFSVKGGGSLNFLYNERLYNGFINSEGTYETIISAGVTLRLEYQFSQEDNSFRISDQLIAPLLSYYSQSAFSAVGEGNHSNHTQALAFIPDVLQLTNRLSVEKPLGNAFQIFVFYNWNYYRIESARPVKNNNQQIGLAIRYTL